MRAAPFFAVYALSAFASAAAPCSREIGAICAGAEAVDEAALVEALKGADIVILGERHDNPAHHEWQARLVAAIAPKGLAFEMVPREREDAANAARASGAGLAAALDWANSGWPDWAMYAPIFAAAPEARIAGGAPPREALNLAAREGAAAAFGAGAARFGLDAPLAGETREAMLKEQEEAHCGALPETMLPGMVEVQRLRDAAFAAAALRLAEAGAGPAALITGNGHARTDRGAPAYLRRAAPALRLLSVGMIEVAETGEAREETAPFDFVIHTPAHDRGDPCAALLERKG
ncbi:MAG: ChaN family lipoprotein [Pikeienuella sp.]